MNEEKKKELLEKIANAKDMEQQNTNPIGQKGKEINFY